MFIAGGLALAGFKPRDIMRGALYSSAVIEFSVVNHVSRTMEKRDGKATST
jgi:hypothetical protein